MRNNIKYLLISIILISTSSIFFTACVKAQYIEKRTYSENLAAAFDGKYWGFIDKKEKWKIKPAFKKAHDFHSGLAAVLYKKEKYWTYINISGKKIIEKANTGNQYSLIKYPGDFYYDVAICKNVSSEIMLINKQGKILYRLKEYGKWNKKTQLLKIKTEENLTLYIDKYGNSITPKSIIDFNLNDSPVLVQNQDEKMNIINSSGKELINWCDTLISAHNNHVIAGNRNSEIGNFEYQTLKLITGENSTDKVYKRIETEYKITDIFYTKDEVFYTIKKGNYFGILNSEFKEILAPNRYKELKLWEFKNTFCVAVYNKKWAVLDNNFNILIPEKHEILELFFPETGLFKFQNNENQLWGIINFKNTIILPAKAEEIVKKGDFWISFNNTLNETIGSKYGKIFMTVSGISFERISKSFTVFDNFACYYKFPDDYFWLNANTGNFWQKDIPLRYSKDNKYTSLSSKYIYVRDKSKYYCNYRPPTYWYIDVDNKIASPYFEATGEYIGKNTKTKKIYDKENIRRPDMIFVIPAFIKKGKNTWRKATSSTSVEYTTDKYYWQFFGDKFSNGLALVSKNMRYGYINSSLQTVIPIKYVAALPFKDNVATVLDSTKQKWGLINREGKYTISPQYDEALIFNEGLCPVSTNDIYYYIDTDNVKQFGKNFEDAKDFSEGLAAIKKNGLWGFINKKGKLVIDYRFRKVYDFENGKAKVLPEKGKYIYINKKGEKTKN